LLRRVGEERHPDAVGGSNDRIVREYFTLATDENS